MIPIYDISLSRESLSLEREAATTATDAVARTIQREPADRHADEAWLARLALRRGRAPLK